MVVLPWYLLTKRYDWYKVKVSNIFVIYYVF